MCNKKWCSVCNKVLNLEKERFVVLGTYDKIKNLEEENFYHIFCFKKFWDSKIQESIKKRINVGLQGVNKLLDGMNKSDGMSNYGR